MACFVVFITGLVVFITYASRQRMDLVRHEVRFQEQLDRMNRTGPLGAAVAITYDASRQSITITLPLAHAQSQISGRIHFYRPSDARLDHQIPLAVDTRGVQSLDVRPLQAGLWKVRVHWSLSSQEYFFAQSVVIASVGKSQIANRNP
jgi:nitrogen fixation protein FixH